jgi:hypothetical protein
LAYGWAYCGDQGDFCEVDSSKETNMASKGKIIGRTDPTQPGTVVEESERLLQSTREQEIRIRAYEIYLQRGGQPGHELDDWLQAESELTSVKPAA